MLRGTSLRAGALLAVVAAAFLACETIDFRRGGSGESCGRTDDCESPLVCVANVCVPPGGGTTSAGGSTSTSTDTGGTTSSGGTGGSTSTSTDTGGTTSSGGTGGDTGGTTSSGGTGGTGGTILDTTLCNECLHDQCGTPIAACNDDCYALEACIETLCSHLSEIASPDEGACQVHCQQLHLASKSKHLAVVNCTLGASCAPCSSYPWDYDICQADASVSPGACSAQYDACNASSDCVDYRGCLASCTTLQECLACDNAPSGPAGAPLLDAYQLCIATQCLALSWIL